MTITSTHLFIFLLLFISVGVGYAVYLLRKILEFVECTFDMSVNIEEATKPQDTEEEFIGAN
jgi:hypothetical protein